MKRQKNDSSDIEGRGWNAEDLIFDFDMLYYIYCVKMRMSEQNFWNSPLKKIVKLIDMYQDETCMRVSEVNGESYSPKYFASEPEIIHSMREVEGFA